jgi:anti-sigma regulatory factor (Ser/Thr protein kinase)
MHVHQYLQMHILGGIVAEVALAVPMSISPEVCRMPYGQQHAPVRPGGGRFGQQSISALPGQVLPGPLLPAARWVCRQTATSPLDTGLACRAARDFTGQILTGWGLLEMAEDAAVIVSELVTNALQHGLRDVGSVQEQVELIWWRRSSQVICMVTDPGTEPPVMIPDPDPLAEEGRGLHVVDALSTTWGWTRLGGCRKAVWATLPVPGAKALGGWHGRSA